MSTVTVPEIVVDLAAFCTFCDWSRYVVVGVDDAPTDGWCPDCGAVAVGLPEPRVEHTEVDARAAGEAMADAVERQIEFENEARKN